MLLRSLRLLLMTVTLARDTPMTKHLFERVLDLSQVCAALSHARSRERVFDSEDAEDGMTALLEQETGQRAHPRPGRQGGPARWPAAPAQVHLEDLLDGAGTRRLIRPHPEAVRQAPRVRQLRADRTAAVHRHPAGGDGPRLTAASTAASAQQSVQPHRRGAGSAVRLTARGRVVLVVMLAVLAVLLFTVGRASAAQRGTARQAVTVQRGESLWSIAQRVAPDSDPRGVVAALERSNHLAGAAVVPGQRLVLPRR